MKFKTLTATALLLAPALLAFQPRGTSITFHVEEGATTTKTFTNTLEMSLDDMSMLMNGSPSPMMPEIDMTVGGKFALTVTDDYVKMRGSMPAKLVRTYDSMEQTKTTDMEMDVMGQVQTQNSSTGSESELEGSTVQFVWNADADEYVASFPDGDGDEKLLEDLTEDMDLRALLPAGEVEEGATWKVSAQALKHILSPGGNLKLIPDDADGGTDMMGMNSDLGNPDDWFNDDLEGEITATFAGTRETEDGVRVAVIMLSIEINNAVDLTEQVQKQLEDAELPPEAEGMEIESMDIEIDLEGEGTLLWNLAKGCAHSFEMETDLGMTVDISMAISVQGQDLSIEQSLEFSGTFSATATIH